MTTGNSGRRCLISRNNASPSIPGMLMSERITISSGPSSASAAQAFLARRGEMQHVPALAHLAAKALAKQIGHVGLVVDDQNAEPHALNLLDAGCAADRLKRSGRRGRRRASRSRSRRPTDPGRAALAGDIGIGVGLGDRGGAGGPHPQQLAVRPARLGQHRAAVVAGVELEQDRARIRRRRAPSPRPRPRRGRSAGSAP